MDFIQKMLKIQAEHESTVCVRKPKKRKRRGKNPKELNNCYHCSLLNATHFNYRLHYTVFVLFGSGVLCVLCTSHALHVQTFYSFVSSPYSLRLWLALIWNNA